MDLSPGQINQLWEPAFSFFERLWLFWLSPVVLFMANSIIQITLTTAFTWLLVHTRPSSDEIRGFEYVMLIYFCSSLWVEAFQVLFSGLAYFREFWNILDLLSSGCFVAGFIVRMEYPDITGQMWQDSVRLEHLWMLLYSITCCGLWCRLLRVLSIEKEMGILVITVTTMFVDILRFAIIWIFLWLAFAVLMRGSARDESRWNFDHSTCTDYPETEAARRATEAEDGGEEEGKVGMQCWSSWWILRLFFQSMGEFYNDDLETDAEMVTLMVMFVVMNILLLNLLIAIMSNSFAKIQEEANRQYLLVLYELSREASRIPIAIPAPLNVPYVIVELVNFLILELNHKSRLIYGMDSWLDRLEAHFGRNESIEHRFKRTIQTNLCALQKNTREARLEENTRLKAWSKGETSDRKQLQQAHNEHKFEVERNLFLVHCRDEYLQSESENQSRENFETKFFQELEKVEDRLKDYLGNRFHNLEMDHGVQPDKGNGNVIV